MRPPARRDHPAIALTHGHRRPRVGAGRLVSRDRCQVYAHPTSTVPHDEICRSKAIWHRQLTLRVIDAPGHTFDHAIFYLPEEPRSSPAIRSLAKERP